MSRDTAQHRYNTYYYKSLKQNTTPPVIKMSMDKTAESAYFQFYKDSTKRSTLIYKLQHQTTEHYCIQTSLTHYTILVHATFVWRRHCTQPAVFCLRTETAQKCIANVVW